MSHHDNPPTDYTTCRGGSCDLGLRCSEAGNCLYKSSAEEAREVWRVAKLAEIERTKIAPAVPCGSETVDEALNRRLVQNDSTAKATNPKDAIGSNKLPLHLWPTTATALGSLGLLDGALKYGRSNFREIGVRASIYYDAASRHLNAWFEGEDVDPDSQLPHLAHALACIAIIVDASAAGKMNDDRAVRGGYRNLIDDLTPHVARLKGLHADKSPKHYTISDNR